MNQNCSQNSVSWAQNIPKMRLRPGLRPGPHWGSLHHSPDPLAGFRGVALRRGRGRGMGEGREGRGEEEEGRGEEGEGEGV